MSLSKGDRVHNLYSLNEKPAYQHALLISLQYIVKFGLLTILPLMIGRAAGVSHAVLLSFVSISLLGGALSSFLLQCKEPFGAYCFIPSIASVSYFACLLQVARTSDIHHVLGAGIIIGVAQLLCSFLFKFIKKLLTIELAGLGLFALGVWAATLGVQQFFYPSGLGRIIIHGETLGTPIQPAALLGLLVLFVMLTCIFVRGFRTIAILVGMLVGWVIGGRLGYVRSGDMQLFYHAPWFYFPHYFLKISFQFSFWQIVLFIIVGIYASFICFSLVTIIMHENVDNWRECYIKRSVGGNMVAGFAAAITSVLGGYPSTPIQGSIGDMITTRAYSRSIAWIYALCLLVLSFMPKLSLFLITMPAAANGAAIILMGGMMAVKGLRLVGFTHLNPAQLKAFSYAVLLLVVWQLTPKIYNLPVLKYFTNVGFIIGYIVLAMLLLLFSCRGQYAK